MQRNYIYLYLYVIDARLYNVSGQLITAQTVDA